MKPLIAPRRWARYVIALIILAVGVIYFGTSK